MEFILYNSSSDYYHSGMEKEKLKIRVVDVHSEQTLYECSIEESEKAHEIAAQMEDMGLNVKVVSPTLSDTLTSSLGLTNEEQSEYLQSMEEEMEDHMGSCCFEDSDKKTH